MNDHRRNNAGSHFENGGGLLISSSANSPIGRFDVGDSSEKIGHRLKEGNFNENQIEIKSSEIRLDYHLVQISRIFRHLLNYLKLISSLLSANSHNTKKRI